MLRRCSRHKVAARSVIYCCTVYWTPETPLSGIKCSTFSNLVVDTVLTLYPAQHGTAVNQSADHSRVGLPPSHKHTVFITRRHRYTQSLYRVSTGSSLVHDLRKPLTTQRSFLSYLDHGAADTRASRGRRTAYNFYTDFSTPKISGTLK